MYGQKVDFAELRRQANANLVALREGKPTPRPVTETYAQRVRALDQKIRREEKEALITLGRRLVEDLDPALKELNRLLKIQKMSAEELGAAEHWQSEIDRAIFDDGIDLFSATSERARRAYKRWRRG
jgi:predicted hydrocarbon binding protein